MKSDASELRRGATAHDASVGERMRARRLALGMDQKSLGEALGVSYQQIQKYEKGKDRLSSARLMKAAAALDMDVGKLIGDDRKAVLFAETSMDWFISSREGCALSRYFEALDQTERRAIIALAKALADRKN